MSVNQGTPFNEHGWSLMIAAMRELQLKVEGANDMNADAGSTSQTEQDIDIRKRLVRVCENGVERWMYVMASEPFDQ